MKKTTPKKSQEIKEKAENNRGYSKLAIVGLILAIINPILILVSIVFEKAISPEIINNLVIAILVIPIIVLVLSIRSLNIIKKHNLQGKFLAIISLCLASLMIILLFLFWSFKSYV